MRVALLTTVLKGKNAAMPQRLLATALLALLLQGCTPPQSNASVTAAPAPAATAAATTPTTPPAAQGAERPALPPGACDKTLDGFGTFLEAIVNDAELRHAYSAPKVTEGDLRDPSKVVDRPSEPFRLTMIDYSWSYDEPGQDLSKLPRVKLDIKQEGDRMRVDFVKAEFSADDEHIKRIGAPEAYVFDYTQHCWRLVQHLR
ncbi:hypothetical protein [uncultured Xanthomonas sp.]|uniref:hypothetical protein n=1 Tax=uncultured Xanthomonas sp. TaxID=152831 RepID=UPI0025E19619|nr:hypothetical protein [uncultured Xanthomonas sp.]